MLRPRESRELRLISHFLTIAPDAATTWAHDVFGNAVALATFANMASTLVIDSVGDILLNAVDWPVFDIAASAHLIPLPLLRRRMDRPRCIDRRPIPRSRFTLQRRARGFVRSKPTDTLSLLKDLNAGVAQRVKYESREIAGTQSPNETLDRGWGSCRDFAVLFTEAARQLGFGARIVSGYLHDPNHPLLGWAESGSIHAWAEVFVPGGLDHLRPDQRSVGVEI
jgi:transglutaminase-like putative cysteine protease